MPERPTRQRALAASLFALATVIALKIEALSGPMQGGVVGIALVLLFLAWTPARWQRTGRWTRANAVPLVGVAFVFCGIIQGIVDRQWMPPLIQTAIRPLPAWSWVLAAIVVPAFLRAATGPARLVVTSDPPSPLSFSPHPDSDTGSILLKVKTDTDVEAVTARVVRYAQRDTILGPSRPTDLRWLTSGERRIPLEVGDTGILMVGRFVREAPGMPIIFVVKSAFGRDLGIEPQVRIEGDLATSQVKLELELSVKGHGMQKRWIACSATYRGHQPSGMGAGLLDEVDAPKPRAPRT